MQVAGKKILEILKSGTPEERTEIGDMLKVSNILFLKPLFSFLKYQQEHFCIEFYWVSFT